MASLLAQPPKCGITGMNHQPHLSRETLPCVSAYDCVPNSKNSVRFTDTVPLVRKASRSPVVSMLPHGGIGVQIEWDIDPALFPFVPHVVSSMSLDSTLCVLPSANPVC